MIVKKFILSNRRVCEIDGEIYLHIQDFVNHAKAHAEREGKVKTSFSITEIASEYGLSAVKLNKIMEEKGIQHHRCGVWHIDHKLKRKGYVVSVSGNYSKTHMRWTLAGKDFITDLLEKNGYKSIK